jgi:hypothetical protein
MIEKFDPTAIKYDSIHSDVALVLRGEDEMSG